MDILRAEFNEKTDLRQKVIVVRADLALDALPRGTGHWVESKQFSVNALGGLLPNRGWRSGVMQKRNDRVRAKKGERSIEVAREHNHGRACSAGSNTVMRSTWKVSRGASA